MVLFDVFWAWGKINSGRHLLSTWIRKLCEILQLGIFSLGMMLSSSLLLQYNWNEKLLATVETSCSPFICDTYYPKHLGNLILPREIVIYFHTSTKRFVKLELKLGKQLLYFQTFQNFRSTIAHKHPVINGVKASAADCILPEHRKLFEWKILNSQ